MSKDLHHLAAAYAVDALDDRERRDFEAHYPSCDICSQEVVDFRETAAALAATTFTAPPANLKAAVMGEIAGTRQLSPVVAALPVAKRPGQWVLAAAAAALLVVGGLVGAVASRQVGSDPVTELVQAPDVRFTTLEGDRGTLQVAYSDDRDQVAVFGTDLPAIDDDEAFALWFFVDDGVAPAGLFTSADGDIRQLLNVDDVATTGWGITVEPDTGSPQPTSDVIYVGTF